MRLVREESDLILAAMTGDDVAFADLIGRVYPAAFRLAYGLLNDKGEAEDAVQESCFKAWKNFGTFRSGSPLRPWFLQIVSNHCRSQRRSRWWSVVRLEKIDRESADPDIAASVDLNRAVRRLSHRDQLAVHLRFTLDLPYDEVASTLGVTEKAARHRVERAVRKLRLLMPEVVS